MSYWSMYASRRRTRRHLLKVSLGLATVAAGANLLGCSDGSSSSEGSGSKLSAPRDTSSDAKRGGTFKGVITAEPRGFDPHTSADASREATLRVYSRLFMFAPAHLGKTPIDEVTPDLAESYEYLPDSLQITLKLRSDARWDSRAPTSGRSVDAQDVVFSWQRYAALSPVRDGLSNAASPEAPVISFNAVDSRTVVVKLAFASGDILTALNRPSSLLIAPREADGGFDVRSELRGSSAWLLRDYRPSQSLSFERNPNWYRKDRPFIDGWELPIIPEYAQQNAQFRSGNIFVGGVNAEDVLSTWRDIPELKVYRGELTQTTEPTLRFGLARADSPFWDQRVRQALSMMIDRETYGRIWGGADDLEAAGLPVEIKWMTHGGANVPIDPKSGKDFGPNAKYYEHNLAEAKKLMAAAGFSNGLETDMYFRSTVQSQFSRFESIVGMLGEGGVKCNIKVVDFTNEFRPKMHLGKGNWDGAAMSFGNADPVADYLWRRYNKAGTVFPGFDPDGKDRLRGDPKVNEITDAMKREFDRTRRDGLVADLLRYLAGTMYEVPAGAFHSGFVPVWPAVQNWGVYTDSLVPSVERDVHLWIDPSKRPIAS